MKEIAPRIPLSRKEHAYILSNDVVSYDECLSPEKARLLAEHRKNGLDATMVIQPAKGTRPFRSYLVIHEPGEKAEFFLPRDLCRLVEKVAKTSKISFEDFITQAVEELLARKTAQDASEAPKGSLTPHRRPKASAQRSATPLLTNRRKSPTRLAEAKAA